MWHIIIYGMKKTSIAINKIFTQTRLLSYFCVIQWNIVYMFFIYTLFQHFLTKLKCDYDFYLSVQTLAFVCLHKFFWKRYMLLNITTACFSMMMVFVRFTDIFWGCRKKIQISNHLMNGNLLKHVLIHPNYFLNGMELIKVFAFHYV